MAKALMSSGETAVHAIPGMNRLLRLPRLHPLPLTRRGRPRKFRPDLGSTEELPHRFMGGAGDVSANKAKFQR